MLTVAAHCSGWFQSTRQMPSAAWHPSARVSLFGWPGVTMHHRTMPHLPCLLPPPWVQGIRERPQHPGLDMGTVREERESEGGHSPNLRRGDTAE